MTSSEQGSVADPGRASHPREIYQSAAARYGAEVSGLERESRRVEAWRMAVFVVGALVGLLRNDLPVPRALSLAVAAAALLVFVMLVIRHRAQKAALRRARAARGLAEMGLLRLERDWGGLAEARTAIGDADPLLDPQYVADESHPYLRDLDVFGPASVRALLGLTPTPTGAATLERWLSAPAAPSEIRRRQGAVRALADDYEGRERPAIESLLVDRIDRQGWRSFLRWLDDPPVFGSDGVLPGWSIVLSRVAPVVTLGLFGVWAFSPTLPSIVWVAPLAAQGILAWRWGNQLTSYLGNASGGSGGLRGHHALFSAWESHATDEPAITKLKSRLGGEGGEPASGEVRVLERWMDWSESRASMVYPFFAAAFLSDVHLAWQLERWRQRVGPHVEEWFEALGELEALSALATLAFDHPAWCWPELREGVPSFEAEGLGHPLLPERDLRTSDVQVDPPGRFLLVTGSNMSGKSTLLRSIGLAAVLAQAGSAVCARRAVLTPLRTFTSMRIHDSITGGVSLFMAELLRLKALVDSADAGGDAPSLLYLIDEVLQGTNSDERRIAAGRIIRHLLGANAIGAVTTHDLALHEERDLDPSSTKVHFREQVGEAGDRVLTFDYQLRPGLATSRNALKLLRIVGLDDEG